MLGILNMVGLTWFIGGLDLSEENYKELVEVSIRGFYMFKSFFFVERTSG